MLGGIVKDVVQEIGRQSVEAEAARAKERAAERKDERQHVERVHAKNLWLYAWIALIIGALVVVAMATNKDELARELLRTVAALGAGGVLGYGAATARQKKSDSGNG